MKKELVEESQIRPGFSSSSETINGRLAMLSMVYILLVEAVTKTGLFL